MRILIFILILSFASCKEKANTPDIFDVNNKVVEQLFEYFNNHEWEKMANLYIEIGEFKDPSFGYGIIKMSREDIVNKYSELHKIFPDIKDEIIATYPSGDKHIIVEFISSGTSLDGVKFELPICSILTIENGKITKDYNYYDNF